MGEYTVDLTDAVRRLNVIDGYDAGNGPGTCVHTFRDSPAGLLGAHWYLDDLKALMAEHGVEESGAAAKSTGHGLVVIDKWGPLFIGTKQDDA
jgi:hypothetical protein